MSSTGDLGLLGLRTSPGCGDETPSSFGAGEVAEVGVMDSKSSSPSNLSPSSGDPSSPPSPVTIENYN